ncbi:O-antigen ligase family protein [Paenibacillus sp. 1001270B_150601_E10]|uniref:O-antigen ligase family protein n=1 Tax=Paenibacillus sp. 1001270B_150601_E10 TaxID=2787079 RepID=UPI001E62586E|nr:O-antigen ligase family protein [Paenibacillus sp. 1001270B_150601_E10]
MSTYGYTNNKTDKSFNVPPIYWLLFGLVTLFLVWAPFRVALFNGQNTNFEQSIYAAALWVAIIGLVTVGITITNKKWTNIDHLTIIIFLLPISYAISLISAASQYLAINMLIITFMYAIFFVASIYLAQQKQFNRLLIATITTISYIVVFFGLFHWLGNGPFINSLVKWLGAPTLDSGAYKDAVMSDSNGARLTSVFQYANTYAAYLMAFLFVAVFQIGHSKALWSKFVHGFMLVPIILSIFLTLSRGGLVLLPVVFVLLLVFLQPHKQLMWILHLAVSSIITFVILNPVTEAGLSLQKAFSASQSLTGWGYVLVSSIIAGGISFALEKWVSPVLEKATQSLSNKKWGNFLIPIGGALLGGLLLFLLISTNVKNVLPENIQTRLENINFEQHSVLERFTFYKDAMKVVKDYPVIGAGGGAWSALYEQYQNNPYTSRQAHNFYLQYLIETGVLGFAIFAVILVYIFSKYIRNYISDNEENRNDYFVYFIIAASILIHSILDFNMSYVYLGILVFICLSGMMTSVKAAPIKSKLKPKTIRITFSTVLSVTSLVVLITASTFISSANAYNKAIKTADTSNSYEEIISPLNKALSIRAHHPEYVSFKANLLIQVYKQTQDEAFYEEAEKLLTDTLKTEPTNKTLLMRMNALYSTKKLEKDIFEIYDSNKYRYPWDIEWYEQYMHISVLLASASLDDQAAKSKYLDVVISSINHINKGIEHLKTLPEGQLQGRKFEITPKVALHSGQAYYMMGQTQQAYDIMKAHLQKDLNDATNAELMTWYLAASSKLKLEDKANLSKLLQVNPDANASIDSILSMKVD